MSDYTPKIHDALCPCVVNPVECVPSGVYGVCGSCRCVEYAAIRADERERSAQRIEKILDDFGFLTSAEREYIIFAARGGNHE